MKEGVEVRNEDKDIVAKTKENILSGKYFMLHVRGARSRFGYMPPRGAREWGQCLRVLALMAQTGEPMAQVATFIVGRIPLYGTDAECEASVWTGAADGLSMGFHDIIGRASPEATGKPSDYKRDFTLKERLDVIYWCEKATRPYQSGAHGVGWAVKAVGAQIGYHPPWDEWE